jgi:hypothetical protein
MTFDQAPRAFPTLKTSESEKKLRKDKPILAG